MSYDPNDHHRRSIRLPGHDYAVVGAYVVTLCTQHRVCHLGAIINDKMCLSDIGRIIEAEWLRGEVVRRTIELVAFVVMPNHLHGIIILTGATEPRATEPRATEPVAPTGPRPGSIGAIIEQFKSVTTKRARTLSEDVTGSLWQRNYYERIIRNAAELERVRYYIERNPINWARDIENPSIPRPANHRPR